MISISATTGLDIPTAIQTEFGGKQNDDAPAVEGLLAVGELSGPGIDGPITVSAPVVEEVDATGAGDSFAAAFLAALESGAPPERAAATACAVAARCVTVMGAMEAEIQPLGPAPPAD